MQILCKTTTPLELTVISGQIHSIFEDYLKFKIFWEKVPLHLEMSEYCSVGPHIGHIDCQIFSFKFKGLLKYFYFIFFLYKHIWSSRYEIMRSDQQHQFKALVHPEVGSVISNVITDNYRMWSMRISCF